MFLIAVDGGPSSGVGQGRTVQLTVGERILCPLRRFRLLYLECCCSSGGVLPSHFDQPFAVQARLQHPLFILRRNPVEQRGRNQPLFPETGVLLADHVSQGFAGGDLIIHQNYPLGLLEPCLQAVAAELLLYGMAVLFGKQRPGFHFGHRLPGCMQIQAFRPQPAGSRCADGRCCFGKTDDQFGPRVLLSQLAAQRFHHLQRLGGRYWDMLGLKGVYQQIGPLGVVDPLSDAQDVSLNIAQAISSIHLRRLADKNPKDVPQAPPTMCMKLATLSCTKTMA